ncbi:hypothetical protein TNCV_3497681 [Trichonephila clavipes]|nr:hypothetical protein TNCV_3497681 [Trichonephila clavipes]
MESSTNRYRAATWEHPHRKRQTDETKIRFNGCPRNNHLYPNSRRESIKENRYLKTLPLRVRLEEENGRTRTKLKYVTRARNGRAQGKGGLTAPKRVRGAPKTQ